MLGAEWLMWLRVDAGTGAEWLSAIGGLLTAGVALFLLWQGQVDRRTDRVERRSEQARRVRVSYPVVTRFKPFDIDPTTGDPRLMAVTTACEVWNASDDVINEVVVTLHHLDGKGFPMPQFASDFRPRMLPGEKWTIEHAETLSYQPTGWQVGDDAFWIPILGFGDANDIRWNRNPRHELVEGEPTLPTTVGDLSTVRPFRR